MTPQIYYHCGSLNFIFSLEALFNIHFIKYVNYPWDVKLKTFLKKLSFKTEIFFQIFFSGKGYTKAART